MHWDVYMYTYVCLCVQMCVCEREMVGVCSWGSVSLQGSLTKQSGVFRDIVGCPAHGPDHGWVAVQLSSYPVL